MDDEGMSVAMSHSGRYVVTGGTRQLVKLWEYPSLRRVGEYQGHSGTINHVRFSPDDRQIISVGDDGITLVWNLYE